VTRLHNVDVVALEETAARAAVDPAEVRQSVELSGDWEVEEGRPQFRGAIPYPAGTVEFTCDFPPPLGGSGAAPNPLAYCFWGGLACYAMTYALEAARLGVELRSLRGTVTTEVDQARALGVSDRPPVEGVTWSLEVDAAAPADVLDRLKEQADARCPGVYCLRSPISLETRVEAP
jgi:uncharacterized OsmC-like protein